MNEPPPPHTPAASPIPPESPDDEISTPRHLRDVNNTPLSTKRARTLLGQETRTPQLKSIHILPQKMIRSAPQLRVSPPVSDGPMEIQPDGNTRPMHNPVLNNRGDDKKRTYMERAFHIEKVIGSGDFGEVFRCACRRTGHKYAIKVSINPVRGPLKYREAISHMSIEQHPNLLKFFHAWDQHDRVWIQTELCVQSLQQWCAVNQTRITDDDVWGFFVDLVRAIDHLHERHIIHDDIKPDNVFLTEYGICKLGDFGLTFNMNNPQHVKSADEGDSKYLAPEVLNGKPTKEADMFSFGVSIFEARTDAALPTCGDTWHKIRNKEFPKGFFEGVCAHLAATIQSLMSPDPKERPTAKALLECPIIREKIRARDLFMADLQKGEDAKPECPPEEPKTTEPTEEPEKTNPEANPEDVFAASKTGKAIRAMIEQQERLKKEQEEPVPDQSPRLSNLALDGFSSDEEPEKRQEEAPGTSSGSTGKEPQNNATRNLKLNSPQFCEKYRSPLFDTVTAEERTARYQRMSAKQQQKDDEENKCVIDETVVGGATPRSGPLRSRLSIKQTQLDFKKLD